MQSKARERTGNMIANASGNALSLEQIAYRQADRIATLEAELAGLRERARLWDWFDDNGLQLEPRAGRWACWPRSGPAFVGDTPESAIRQAMESDECDS